RVLELVEFGRFPHSRRLTAADRKIVDSALTSLDVSEISHRPIDELSGGQRQRAFLAMVLAQDTDYVLLDEPLSNLDMRHAVQLMKLTRRLADEQNRAVVMVVHDVNFATAFSDMLVAMKDGQIHTAGTVHEVMRNEVLSDLYDMPIHVADVEGRPTLRYF
ncbi:ATP-binding cassette domain-containing protein, partial [Auritidibacter ignavus]|uniref:ATP-binding cassette domain-containing protein n=1 Tax=Auritidibacter ignavus TaxID=678932 RepID=UPI002FE5E996